MSFKGVFFLAASTLALSIAFTTPLAAQAEDKAAPMLILRQAAESARNLDGRLPAGSVDGLTPAGLRDLLSSRSSFLNYTRMPKVTDDFAFKAREEEHRELLKFLVQFHKHRGNLSTALNYQKRLLRKMPGELLLEVVSEYRSLLVLANQRGFAAEEVIPVDPSEIRRIKLNFGGMTRNRLFYEALAEYYVSILDFREAKKYIFSALEYRQGEDAAVSELPETRASLHRLLRDIYILEGNYKAALAEQEWLLQTSRTPGDDAFALRAFLRELAENPISPLDIRYNRGKKGILHASVAKSRGETGLHS